MRHTVLVVEDTPHVAEYLATLLGRRGYDAFVARTGAEGRRLMAERFPDVVLMDLGLPDANGAELLAELRPSYPESQFIIITGDASVRSVVEALRNGASNYLVKPFESDAVLVAVEAALREAAKRGELDALRSRYGLSTGKQPAGTEMVARSRSMREVLAVAHRVAAQDGIVLLLGDSGTGKDVMARWIHNNSRRASGPFFSINCAALSRELAESELFGHEPGAFTGTRGRKRGMVELAENGTLFLNEVGELDLTLQAKLLTFLDTRSFMRVGGQSSVEVNSRILAATNRDLAAEVERGRFRGDLYYRLNVVSLRLPVLRERREDIPLLARSIVERLAVELGYASPPAIDPGADLVLSAHDWPGNVRELRNVIERAMMFAGSGPIRREHLQLRHEGKVQWFMNVSFPTGRSLHDVTRQVARGLIEEALRRGEGSRQEAARLLGLSRHALAYQMKTLGLDA